MIELYNEDCLVGMDRLEDNSIDLIVTDPPYNITAGEKGGAFGGDKRNYHKSVKKMSSGISNNILDQFVRIQRNINLYIWCNKDQLGQYINYFENIGCTTDLLTWHKTNPIPTCNNKYLSDTEYLLYFRRGGVPMYGSYQTKKKYYITPTNKKDKDMYGHPTIKPLDITKNIIVNSSKEGDTILDAFMGSGTTGVACVGTGRNFIGFEVEKDYFDIAKNRIEEEV